MTGRNEYEEQIRARMQDFTIEIDNLKKKASAATDRIAAEYPEQIAELEKMRADLEKQLDALKASSDEAWGEIQSGIDRASGELQRALERALTKFKGL
ncbi:MAG: hypothetical protein GKC04_05065 [Methanomicrobiales archaeon]|nr:hypothetical protein [Methanomicrobiales archaeon]